MDRPAVGQRASDGYYAPGSICVNLEDLLPGWKGKTKDPADRYFVMQENGEWEKVTQNRIL